MNRFITILSLLVFLYSCKPIQPLAPSIPTTDVPSIVEPPSQVDIPILAELKPYFAQAETSVPTEMNGGDNPFQGLRYAYHFQRSRLDISVSGNVVKLSVLGSYGAEGAYCATCVFGNCVTPKIAFSCGNGSETMKQLPISLSIPFVTTNSQ